MFNYVIKSENLFCDLKMTQIFISRLNPEVYPAFLGSVKNLTASHLSVYVNLTSLEIGNSYLAVAT